MFSPRQAVRLTLVAFLGAVLGPSEMALAQNRAKAAAKAGARMGGSPRSAPIMRRPSAPRSAPIQRAPIRRNSIATPPRSSATSTGYRSGSTGMRSGTVGSAPRGSVSYVGSRPPASGPRTTSWGGGSPAIIKNKSAGPYAQQGTALIPHNAQPGPRNTAGRPGLSWTRGDSRHGWSGGGGWGRRDCEPIGPRHSSTNVVIGSSCNPGFYGGVKYPSTCYPLNYGWGYGLGPGFCGYGYNGLCSPWYGTAVGYPLIYSYGPSADYVDLVNEYAYEPYSGVTTDEVAVQLIQQEYLESGESISDGMGEDTAPQPTGISESISSGPRPRLYERVERPDGSWEWVATEDGVTRSWQALRDMESALHRGDAAFELGRYEEAREYYVQAMVAGGDDPRARIALGVAEFALGRFGQSSQAIRHGIVRAEALAHSAFDLRDVYARQDDLERHRAALEEFVDAHSGDLDAQFLWGFVQYFSGSREAGKITLQRYVARPGADSYVHGFVEAALRRE